MEGLCYAAHTDRSWSSMLDACLYFERQTKGVEGGISSAHARRGRRELRSVSRTISRTSLARLDSAIRTLRPRLGCCPTTVVMAVCGVINL